jgi:hypothetical protein
MSAPGQTRHFDGAPTTSGLPLSTDILTLRQHVSNVPRADIGNVRIPFHSIT